MSLQQIRVEQKFDVGTAEPETDAASDVLTGVLHCAGASHRRDAADERLIKGVRDR